MDSMCLIAAVFKTGNVTHTVHQSSLSQVMNDHPNCWPLHATKPAETPMLQCAGREAIVQELTCGL